MGNAHSNFSPSAADRWAVCTASWEMNNQVEQEESDYAREGTEAHELLEACVKGKCYPDEIDAEHHAKAEVRQAMEYIMPYILDPEYTVLSETQVKLNEDCWGTADVIVIGKGSLIVIDYKHGQGIAVEANSLQGKIYSAAALTDLEFFFDEPITDVEVVIIQPRASHEAGPIRKYKNKAEFFAGFKKFIGEKIDCIKNGETEFSPGDKQCKWCAVSGKCEAQAKFALEKCKSHFGPTGAVILPKDGLDSAGELTNDQRVSLFECSKFIKDFVNKVEAQLEKDMMAGVHFDGLKVVAGRSIRKWDFEDDSNLEEFFKTELKLKKSEYTKESLLGPAPIEKLIDPNKRGGKKKLEAFKSHVIKPEGKPQVALETDSRPPISFFSDVDPLS